MFVGIHETHVPTETAEATAHPWLPRAAADVIRPPRTLAEKGEGAFPPRGALSRAMALPAAMRFPNRRAIQRVRQVGQRRRAVLGTVTALPEPHAGGQVLFIVPRRVSRRSAERNRLRRHLEAWAEEHRHRMRGVAVVVVVSPALTGASRRVLREAAATTFPPR